MKLAICLALFAITSFVASQNTTDPDFLFSHNWKSTGTIPADLTPTMCCMPEGKITFSTYGSQVTLIASSWTGTGCYDFDAGDIPFPFSNTSSFNELVAAGNQTSVWSTDIAGINLNRTVSVGNYSTNSTNGDISWSISFKFDDRGTCVVKLTNSSIGPEPKSDYESDDSSDDTSDDETDSDYFDSDVLASTTWTTTGTSPANLANVGCCMPVGTINFYKDKYATNNTLLDATQWSGDLCADLQLTPSTKVDFPFANISSSASLATNVSQTAQWDTETVIFSYGNYSSNSSSGEISWTFTVNFENTAYEGGICTVALTNLYVSDYSDSDTYSASDSDSDSSISSTSSSSSSTGSTDSTHSTHTTDSTHLSGFAIGTTFSTLCALIAAIML